MTRPTKKPGILPTRNGDTIVMAPENRAEQAPEDLIEVTARLMVTRMLEAAPGLLPALRQGGAAVVVEVPGSEYVNSIAEAWDELFPQGVASLIDPDGFRFDDETNKAIVPCLKVLAAEEKKLSHRDGSGIAMALSLGRNVVGISHSPGRLLPAELIRGADFSLTVSPLDQRDLAGIVEKVTASTPTTAFPQDLCRLVSISDLRLAHRPRQSADEFFKRLKNLVDAKKPKGSLTLHDLHGMAEAVEWGISLAADLDAYTKGRIPWAAIDRGACLYGPPGTGKTTLAKALATTCDIPLIIGSLYQWQSAGHLGDLQKAMRGTFEQARKAAPCILFIDEIDSFGDRESFSHDNRDYSVQVVNGLLEEIDGVNAREGVVLLAACNHPNSLDPAIIRSGRLDRMIRIPLPDCDAMVHIFRHHVGADLPATDLTRVATLALGATGADVAKWVRGAKRRARNEGRTVGIDDLLAEIRTKSDRKPDSTWICAVHEGGHAVVTALLRPGDLIAATIRETAITGGGVTIKAGDGIATRQTILADLIGLLGGRAAEEIVLGTPSASSGGNENSDLARATALAASMLTAFGFDDGPGMGLLWLGEVTPRNIDVSLRLRPNMETKVLAILADAYDRCLTLLRTNRTALEAV